MPGFRTAKRTASSRKERNSSRYSPAMSSKACISPPRPLQRRTRLRRIGAKTSPVPLRTPHPPANAADRPQIQAGSPLSFSGAARNAPAQPKRHGPPLARPAGPNSSPPGRTHHQIRRIPIPTGGTGVEQFLDVFRHGRQVFAPGQSAPRSFPSKAGQQRNAPFLLHYETLFVLRSWLAAMLPSDPPSSFWRI